MNLHITPSFKIDRLCNTASVLLFLVTVVLFAGVIFTPRATGICYNIICYIWFYCYKVYNPYVLSMVYCRSLYFRENVIFALIRESSCSRIQHWSEKIVIVPCLNVLPKCLHPNCWYSKSRHYVGKTTVFCVSRYIDLFLYSLRYNQ